MRFEQIKTQQGMQWVTALPRRLLTFIGACEILGEVGVILPAVPGVFPQVTVWAAAGLASIMILAAGFHLTRREYLGVVVNLVLFTLAGFVVYGRFIIAPFS